MTPRGPRAAVVGAGLAGLAAARALEAAGWSAVLFDKARGVGGRTSVRRADGFAFDHGAQYFTARSEAFRRELDGWIEAGVAARWDGRVVALAPYGRTRESDSVARYVGVPAMNAPAKHLARGLDVRTGVRVSRAERRGGAWELVRDDGAVLGRFDALVATPPPPQARALVDADSPALERAAAPRPRPCRAALLGLERRWDVDFDGAFCDSPVLSWIARDSSKPGRPGGEAWVLHADAEWSDAHAEVPDGDAVRSLAAEAARLADRPLPPILHASAHSWRYALHDPSLESGCLVDAKLRLALAGDAYAGGRVEGAWTSGVRAARALLGREARARSAAASGGGSES